MELFGKERSDFLKWLSDKGILVQGLYSDEKDNNVHPKIISMPIGAGYHRVIQLRLTVKANFNLTESEV